MSTIVLFSKNETFIKRVSEILENVSQTESITALHEYEIIISDPTSAMELLKSSNMSIMVLSDNPQLNEGLPLLKLGAKAYTNLYIHKEHLMSAIDAVKSGQIWMSPSFMQELILNATPSKLTSHPKLDSLTNRENEIAQLVKQGMTNKEIASKLNITERTVKQHLTHVYEKLEIHDRLSLATLL